MSLVENLEIKVNNIQFVGDQDVHIRFQGIDSKGQLNLSGFVVTTQEEYFMNASMVNMQKLVKEKVLERLNGDKVEAPAE